MKKKRFSHFVLCSNGVLLQKLSACRKTQGKLIVQTWIIGYTYITQRNLIDHLDWTGPKTCFRYSNAGVVKQDLSLENLPSKVPTKNILLIFSQCDTSNADIWNADFENWISTVLWQEPATVSLTRFMRKSRCPLTFKVDPFGPINLCRLLTNLMRFLTILPILMISADMSSSSTLLAYGSHENGHL